MESSVLFSEFTSINRNSPVTPVKNPAPARKRKRKASRPSTVPVPAVKRGETRNMQGREQSPKQSKKSKQINGLRDQSISAGLRRTKGYLNGVKVLVEKEPSRDGQFSRDQEDLETLVVGEISAKTTDKLATFKFKRQSTEGVQNDHREDLSPELSNIMNQPVNTTCHEPRNNYVTTAIFDEPLRDLQGASTQLFLSHAFKKSNNHPSTGNTADIDSSHKSISAIRIRHPIEVDQKSIGGQGNLEGTGKDIYGLDNLAYNTQGPSFSKSFFPERRLPITYNSITYTPSGYEDLADEDSLDLFTEPHSLTPYPQHVGYDEDSALGSTPSPVGPEKSLLHYNNDAGAMDDEFPVDDEILDELMINFPLVQETCAAPSSILHIPCGNDPQTEDLCGSWLKESKPGLGKSFHSVNKLGEYDPIIADTTAEAFSLPLSCSNSTHTSECEVGDTTGANVDHIGADQLDEGWISLSEDEDMFSSSLGAVSGHTSAVTLRSNFSPASAESLQNQKANTFQGLVHTLADLATSSPHLDSFKSSRGGRNPATRELPPHWISLDQQGIPKPFVRPPFPKPILDRSPIVGLTSQSILRTCFRVGEALNAATVAFASKIDTITELYAVVASSEREIPGWRQHFQFIDLFTSDKSPVLHGTYDLWRGVELWDADSKAFLGENGKGKIARVVGKMRREDSGGKWRMVVLGVWEAGWDDVGWVKGIVCA